MYRNRINYKLLNFLILMGLLYIIVTNIGTWFQIFMSVVRVCLPFLIAFAIAYALSPFVRKLEAKGVRKSLAVTTVVLGTLVILVAILSITLPLLYNQLVSFASSIGTVLEDVGEKFNWDLTFVENAVNSFLGNAIDGLAQLTREGTFDFVGKTMSFLGNLVIVFVVTTYFLSYMDKIRAFFKRVLQNYRNKSYQYVKTLDHEFSNYLKGLGLFMVIQFFEYSIVFLIAGHPNWLLFGVLASLTTIIPYFGGLFTNILALLTASVVSSKVFIATLIICLIFPQLDGYIISPRVYGKTNNINPLVTIMVVSIGGTIGGFFGIVIALPVYILISTSYRFFKNDIKKGMKKVKEQIK
ncbi:MAG TPA: AI-2E family transporter [Candidatus Onthousia faecigallinarum]|nr:AI-2E family transporter [Candidatus Onthousia faecigallinarum]